MRKIKFRGFHADESGKTIIKLDGKEIKGTWYKGDLSTDGGYYIQAHAVLPETVGQYTGFDDAVRREIFENDIVKEKDITHQDEIQIFGAKSTVVFNSGCWMVDGKRRDFLYGQKHIKVIGNIFENPELLEVEE